MLAFGAAVALAAVACTNPQVCARPETEEPIVYTGGQVENGVYMSSAWDGELLHFPGGAYYELRHGLGTRPRWLTFYLSFERNGVASGSLALAAGNQAEVKRVDEESIVVLNGSCVEYWLLAVAAAGVAGAAGAGGGGGMPGTGGQGG